MSTLKLNNDWLVRYEGLHWGPEMSAAVERRDEGWLHSDLPCDVHMPLLKNGLIPEPLEGANCFKSEWVEEKSWWFKKVFTAEEELLEGDVIELTLESLDAEGDIFLNGIHLGHHRSAFYPFVMDVKKYLVQGQNVLLVRVTSGLEHFSHLDSISVWNSVSMENKKSRSDRRRPMVRKPQYVYGWDWGPRVATIGIMKGAYLESLKGSVIRGVHGVTRSVDKDASLSFEVEVENLRPIATQEALVRLEVWYGEEKAAEIVQEVLLRSGINFVSMETVVGEARLWWPNGMGEQSLYTIKASVESGEDVSFYKPFKFGIRTVRLDLEKLREGERRFAFEINGVRTFSKGGNWIPADSIYARVTDEKYETLIREAAEANFNMLRIWGGGIYERDVFYEKCNEYGIMIWHDFMFACALYPDHLDWFRQEAEQEINYQTQRLRNHPSIVLWSGNNENQMGFHSWWQGPREALVMGGIAIYNEIAPRIVKNNCPNIPYWNGSPYGGEDPNSNEIGDRHHWGDCTMNPDMEKRITPEEYDKVCSKFVSEYGYIGPCPKSSIVQYHGGLPVDRKGEIWDLHNNTFEKATVPAGIAKHYGNPEKMDLDEYLLYAGLVQGLMYNYSLEAMRFKEECGGSLFWMYNDTWGEVGWTIIDYYLRRKPSYYYVKRAFAPVKLILREKDGIVGVMGINDTGEDIDVELEYGYTDFSGEEKTCKTKSVRLPAYSRQRVMDFTKGEWDFAKGLCYVKPLSHTDLILPAVLRSGVLKDLKLPKAEASITNFRWEGSQVYFTVSSPAFIHAVHFSLGDDVHISDEYFDLLPGEKRQVVIYNPPQGLSEEQLKASGVVIPE